MSAILIRCWSECPALFYGLSIFIGASLAIFDICLSIPVILILILLYPIVCGTIIPKEIIFKVLFSVVLGCISFLYAQYRYQIPPSNEDQLKGKGYISFSSVTHSKTPFGLIWTYKGTLHTFVPDGHNSKMMIKNLPITFSLPSQQGAVRPSADDHYILKARLKKSEQGRYRITSTKQTEWEAIKTGWGLVEWRFKAKTYLREYVYKIIKDPHAAAFLSGIATGEFDDRQLSFELGRFGLQHLMAISGLHFAFLASMCSYVLRIFFHPKLTAFILIAFLSAYFIFLGITPSVIRSWTMIVIGLMGTILTRRCIALNSLGLALLAMTCLDPFAPQNIGFQFSFAITGAILVWYAPCERLCQKVFDKRNLSEIADMGSISQHGYCLISFLRQALALSLAVNLVAIPMTLYHYHKFPLMGLAYNLFFPFLMSFSMLLLASGLLFTIIPWIASIIHGVNEQYTQFMLSFAFNLPKWFDISFRMSDIPKEGLMIYLIVIFAIGLWINFSIVDRMEAETPIY